MERVARCSSVYGGLACGFVMGAHAVHLDGAGEKRHVILWEASLALVFKVCRSDDHD